MGGSEFASENRLACSFECQAADPTAFLFCHEQRNSSKVEGFATGPRFTFLIVESKLVLDGYLVTAISLQGDPRLELCSEIELLKPTMVVIGTKGTGLLETPLGSTARYISEHCKYPVLIVHPTPALPTLAE